MWGVAQHCHCPPGGPVCRCPPPFGFVSEGCHRIEPTPSGLTPSNPCDGVCGPFDVREWQAHARAYLDAASASPLSSADRSRLVALENLWSEVGGAGTIPFFYASVVARYMGIAQAAACLIRSALPAAERPPPPPPPPPSDVPEDGGFTFPSLPGFPGFPALPSFSWPGIPDWIWLVAIGAGVLLLATRGERERR